MTLASFSQFNTHLHWIINVFTSEQSYFLEKIKNIFPLGDKYSILWPCSLNVVKILWTAQVCYFKLIGKRVFISHYYNIINIHNQSYYLSLSGMLLKKCMISLTLIVNDLCIARKNHSNHALGYCFRPDKAFSLYTFPIKDESSSLEGTSMYTSPKSQWRNAFFTSNWWRGQFQFATIESRTLIQFIFWYWSKYFRIINHIRLCKTFCN